MNNTFKIIYSILAILIYSISHTAAASLYDIPNNLAQLGVIESHYSDPYNYNLGANISRREMLKIMMNLSSQGVVDRCDGRFIDMHSDDWRCKYAESALRVGYIAPNPRFRPDDYVTEAEALKMIMQSRNIPKTSGITNWVQAYNSRAIDYGILDKSRVVGDSIDAKRSMVFTLAYDAIHATLDTDSDDVSLDFSLDDFLDDIFTDTDVVVDIDIVDAESRDIDIIDTDDIDTPTIDSDDTDVIVDTIDTDTIENIDTDDIEILDISKVEPTILTPGDAMYPVMVFDLGGVYDDILLTDLYLSNVASDDDYTRADLLETIDDIFIYIDGHRYTGYVLDGDTIYFNFGDGYTIKRGERSKFIVTMSIIDSRSRATRAIQLQVLQPDNPVDGTISGMRLISKSNGSLIDWKNTNDRDIISSAHLISRTTPTISLDTDSISTNDIYKFGLTADQNRDLIIDSVSFSIYISGDVDLDDPSLNISLKRAGGYIVSEGDDITIDGNNIIIRFDNTEIVSAGATINYTLSLSGINIPSGSNREVQMIDFVYQNDLSRDIVDIVSTIGYFDRDNNLIIPSDTVSFRY